MRNLLRPGTAALGPVCGHGRCGAPGANVELGRNRAALPHRPTLRIQRSEVVPFAARLSRRRRESRAGSKELGHSGTRRARRVDSGCACRERTHGQPPHLECRVRFRLRPHGQGATTSVLCAGCSMSFRRPIASIPTASTRPASATAASSATSLPAPSRTGSRPLPRSWPRPAGGCKALRTGSVRSPRHPVAVVAFNGALDLSIPLSGGLQQRSWAEPVEVWSARESVDFWVRANGCRPEPEVERNIRRSFRTLALRRAAQGAAKVVQYVLLDRVGHAWPGRRREAIRRGDEPARLVSANALMIELFRQHPKKR